MKRRGQRAGDTLVIDDRTGFRCKAPDIQQEWTGARVHRRVWEARHPQDFVRSRREDMRIKDPRPPPVDTYAGPLRTEITTASLAGSRVIVVRNTERFLPGDRVGIFLASGDVYRAVVQEVTDATNLLLTADLPEAVPVDNVVINYTAVSPAVLA